MIVRKEITLRASVISALYSMYKVLMVDIEVFRELKKSVPERTHLNRGGVIIRTI